MTPSTLLIIALSLIVILLVVGYPLKFTRLITYSIVRVGIGILVLFFINVFGNTIGLHIPINLFTVFITSLLGLFGASSLAIIHIFIL